MKWRLALIVLGACGGNNSATLGGAGMAAAIGVAQTAVYRKTTGYACWAQCQQGSYCDKSKGECVRNPCGACQADQRCDVHGEIAECVDSTHHEQTPADEPMCAAPDASILLRVPCDGGRD